MSQRSDAALERVRAAKPLAKKIFGDLLGEVAVGVTRVEGVYCLKVNITSPPHPSVKLPSRVGDIPVRIEVTGPISKRKASI